jgi:hypothetical protein
MRFKEFYEKGKEVFGNAQKDQESIDNLFKELSTTIMMGTSGIVEVKVLNYQNDFEAFLVAFNSIGKKWDIPQLKYIFLCYSMLPDTKQLVGIINQPEIGFPLSIEFKHSTVSCSNISELTSSFEELLVSNHFHRKLNEIQGVSEGHQESSE